MIGGQNARDFNSQFYGAWAEKQLQDPFREIVLQWKATHLASLFKRHLPHERPGTICEIGGAEGTVLFVVGGLLGARDQFNYEPSREFCETGREKYPGIHFLNSVFRANGDRYDVVILSDILEHVEDEDTLLADAGARCRFALIKMPIERSLSLSSLGYLLRGKSKPPEMIFGPKHYNGHLRGYTVRSALSIIRRRLEVIDWYAIDHSFYYRGSARFALSRSWIGLSPLMRIFGGSLFILARGKC
jgi:hypothetical protein